MTNTPPRRVNAPATVRAAWKTCRTASPAAVGGAVAPESGQNDDRLGLGRRRIDQQGARPEQRSQFPGDTVPIADDVDLLAGGEAREPEPGGRGCDDLHREPAQAQTPCFPLCQGGSRGFRGAISVAARSAAQRFPVLFLRTPGPAPLRWPVTRHSPAPAAEDDRECRRACAARSPPRDRPPRDRGVALPGPRGSRSA